MDNFIYSALMDTIEQQFESILSLCIKVKFTGIVNWFLGTHVTWLDYADGHLSVHMCKVLFAQISLSGTELSSTVSRA